MAQNVGNEAGSQLNSNQGEINLHTDYVRNVVQCRQHFLSAQCERQAKLAHENEQYALKQLQQQQQHEQAQIQAKKRALAHQPLSKPEPKPLNNVPRQPLQPRSVSHTVVPTKTTNQRSSVAKVSLRASHRTATLSQQPSPTQQRSNAAKFADKQAEIAQRQVQTQQKQAQRHAKDSARQAQGYTVDKP